MAEKQNSAASMKIRLTIYAEDEKHEVDVPALPCVIGRGEQCDIKVNDPSVSTRHAMLSSDAQGRLTLTDLGSTNGIYINRRKIERVALDLPAELRLGHVTIVASGPGGGGGRPSQTTVMRPAQDERRGCYYRHDGREFGPFTRDELQAIAVKGALRYRDLVWTGEDEDWLRADLVPWLYAEKARKAETPAPEKPRLPQEKRKTERRPKKRKEGDIICPHCWHQFDVEDFLFIARHHDLVGDSVLGPEAQQRFLPSRFTPEGHAIDGEGLTCPDMACPRCHLRIPTTASDMPPLFASIVGAPATGKSYFLTAMVWRLRNMLARNFAMTFHDTDALTNQIINDFEEKLFLNADQDALVALRKTELQGELYNQVMLDGMITNLPKPFLFSITPAEHHPEYEKAREKMSRTLVLYDNAGESFEPGMDSVDNPTTQHICYSDTIYFLFDPTKDVRFRKRCTGKHDPQLAKDARVQRQEVLLTEMINRIEKYTGKKSGRKSTKTLVILVPKSDIWLDLLGYEIPKEPWEWDSESRTCVLDLDAIMSTSFSVRALLEQTCPELVSTAESFAGDILFLPNSALGGSPELDPETNMLGVRPRDIDPFWISVPMLYLLYRQGLIEQQAPKGDEAVDVTPEDCSFSGDIAFVSLPDDEVPLQVPLVYRGRRLRCPRSGRWFRVPEV